MTRETSLQSGISAEILPWYGVHLVYHYYIYVVISQRVFAAISPIFDRVIGFNRG